jgi:ribose/xylose/arabinose/galactoside ABC-type transport system permease subunit
MTTTRSTVALRRLDVASLALLLIGLVFGVFSYWLITAEELSPLVIVPSMVAAIFGATHLVKREAPRR